MAVNETERRNLAILLKMIDDEPLMVQYLNDANLINFVKLDLYDGTKLRLTPKGQKFVDSALKNNEPRFAEDSLVGWSGELGSNPRKKLSKEMSKRVSLKIRKLVREGYPVKQAAAIAYGYARAHKLGKRGGKKRNPSDQTPIKVPWLKEEIPFSMFEEIADYYSDFKRGHIRWFNEPSGEGMVRIDEGPLKDFSVFVHGSAFGGDVTFGQNTRFEAKEKMPVMVKLYVDTTSPLMVEEMRASAKNPSKKVSREEIEKKLKEVNAALDRLDAQNYPTYGDEWQYLSEVRRDLKELLKKKNPISKQDLDEVFSTYFEEV